MLKTSSTDMATKAAAELTYALQNPTPASPFHKFGDETLRALDKLGEIFSKSYPTKEDKEQQKFQKQLPLTVAAPRVENITPPKTNIIPQIDPKVKYVAAPRVINPKEKMAMIENITGTTKDTQKDMHNQSEI